jgi:hypothetical protein
MDRRVTLVAALVCLVALSGCSALIGDEGTPAPTAEPDGTVTATATPAGSPGTPTTATEDAGATPTTTPTTVPSTPTATRTGETSGTSFDASALEAAHVRSLRDAGSFRTSSSLVIRNETTTRIINGSYVIEAGGPALNSANVTFVTESETSDFPPTTRYTEGETTYERRIEDDRIVYRKGVEPYNVSDPDPVDPRVAYTLGSIATAVVNGSTWNVTGTGTLEGADVTRYEASGDAFDAEGYPNANGTATLVVDETGIVRFVAYRFAATPDGERTEYVYEAGYTDVGATTVEEPEWTAEA